jgi:2-polyprenyl-6-hydroxyphenyl methylase/3-demethylubiquinone-9 3-methyltransferase
MNDEVNKFQKQAQHWWNSHSGPFKMLHQINPLRLEFICQQLKGHFTLTEKGFSDLAVLDLCCGGGLASIPLAKLGCKVSGVDASSLAIEAATRKAAQEKVDAQFFCSTAQSFVCEQKFDVILCLDAVEHLDSLDNLAGKIASLLAPNGVVIISTINKTPKAFLLAIAMAEYALRLLPKGTHSYSKFVSPAMLQHAFLRYGLSIAKISGIGLNLAGWQWSLSNKLDVNYIACLR